MSEETGILGFDPGTPYGERSAYVVRVGDEVIYFGETPPPTVKEHISRLEAKNARLREALKEAVYQATHLSPMEDDGSHWAKMSGEWLAQARAALEQE